MNLRVDSVPYCTWCLGVAITLVVGCTGPATAQFEFNDNGAQLALFYKSTPVLIYNYGQLTGDNQQGGEGWVRNTSFIHPLFGLDGRQLTANWPADRLDQRGVFWSWPRIKVENSVFDLSRGDGLRQVFERWRRVQAGRNTAVIVFDNALIATSTGTAVAMETIEIRVEKGSLRERSIDISIKLINVHDAPIELLPQGDGDECILAFRHEDERQPFVFANSDGLFASDSLRPISPWADISAREPRRSQYSGVALFHHPLNPGGKDARWVTRQDGLIGAQFQLDAPIVLTPGEDILYRFRIYIHAGYGKDAQLQKAYDAYISTASLETN